MANTIIISGSILNSNKSIRYSPNDTSLIYSVDLQKDFGGEGDYVEYFVYDANNVLLYSNYDYASYKLPTNRGLNPGIVATPNTTGDNTVDVVGIVSNLTTNTSSLYPIIEIDPLNDLQNVGYNSGEFTTHYNFFKNRLSNSNDKALFVKEISPDRTEVRLSSTTISDEEMARVANELITEMTNDQYYVDYLLNFGNGEQFVAVNVAFNANPGGNEILFKLYQPLPQYIQVKYTLWIVEEKADPYNFTINLDKLLLPAPPPTLRGPNFDIPIDNQNTVSTQYTNYNNLVTSLQALQSSSYHKILNLITSQSIDINVDYTNFSNFVNFGSAYKRVSNFYDKVKQIEDYNTFITSYTPYVATTSSLQTTINQLSSSITNVISEFDSYESYLYFESSSYTWPKINDKKPYRLLSTSSLSLNSWYTALTASAYDYDNENVNNLEYALPAFIKEDSTNQPFLTFLNMVGHYFDNIWVYLNSVTDLNLANNSLDYGISKDLVYDRLRSLGVKLYNSHAGVSLDQHLIGANSGSSVFDNDFSITGSYLNNIPRKDLVAELYKRIYHNLPYLLKTKGTVTGLEALTTTFGITSSILNVKEYGGATKAELLNTRNIDKVRIIENDITGSVLSNIVSLQTYPTSSDLFRDADMNYIDISFSPETQMDTYTSASIASNNPTWRLDNYIGDPRQQYSQSYSDLDTQRTLYYQTGVTGYAPFTASALDYNGFIRLIQYFDNSLFKMLEDFTPLRSSLSTGVTINSPLLERNKVVIAVPSGSSKIDVKEGEVPEPSKINNSYDNVYYTLINSGSGVEYFNGQYNGAILDINNNFKTKNQNPYLGDISVYNSQILNISQSIDINKFNHSGYNVLLNNVTQGVLSTTRRNIEPIFGTTSSVTNFAELQDSYESLSSYQLSRYDGSKVSSLLYNTYTPSSGSYAGDYSFGKTAAIDRESIKIGYFTEIIPSLFFPKRNNAVLKYLVDSNGSFTELNLRNHNWQDVQNIFVGGDKLNVSLFNNQLYSNQKITDGIKTIYDSGYNYGALLYFSSSATADRYLYFSNVVNSSAYLSKADNFSSIAYFVKGATPITFPIITDGSINAVVNIFNNELQDENNRFTPGRLNNPPTYSVGETGQYNIQASMDMYLEMPGTANNITWSLQTLKNNTVLYNDVQEVGMGNRTTNCYYWNVRNTSDSLNIRFRYTNCSTGAELVANQKPGFETEVCSRFAPVALDNPSFLYVSRTDTVCSTYNEIVPISSNISFNTNLAAYSFSKDDEISFKLRLVNTTSQNFTASLTPGSLTIGSLSQQAGYTTVFVQSTGCFDRDTIINNTNVIAFNRAISSYYGDNYIFDPNPATGSIGPIKLYSIYGDVDYVFNPKQYDKVLLYLNDNTYVEFTILNVILDNGILKLVLDKPLSLTAKNNLTSTSAGQQFNRFLLLSRVPDETNVILEFTKRPGKTSDGFILPQDVSSVIVNNINIITKETKQKLLANQSIIDSLTGGGF
jgi:hypothetical protein